MREVVEYPFLDGGQVQLPQAGAAVSAEQFEQVQLVGHVDEVRHEAQIQQFQLFGVGQDLLQALHRPGWPWNRHKTRKSRSMKTATTSGGAGRRRRTHSMMTDLVSAAFLTRGPHSCGCRRRTRRRVLAAADARQCSVWSRQFSSKWNDTVNDVSWRSGRRAARNSERSHWRACLVKSSRSRCRWPKKQKTKNKHHQTKNSTDSSPDSSHIEILTNSLTSQDQWWPTISDLVDATKNNKTISTENRIKSIAIGGHNELKLELIY